MHSAHMPFNPQEMEAVELHPAICGLIWALPWWDNGDWKSTRDWTIEERDLWIKAFIAVTDLILVSEKPSAEKDEPPPVVAKAAPTAPAKTNNKKPPVIQEIPAFADEVKPIADLPVSIDAETNEKFVEDAPYRGSKRAAQIIWDIIQRAGKSASVWLNKEGRIRVGKPDRQPTDSEELVGVYAPTVRKSEIVEDLKAAGP